MTITKAMIKAARREFYGFEKIWTHQDERWVYALAAAFNVAKPNAVATASSLANLYVEDD